MSDVRTANGHFGDAGFLRILLLTLLASVAASAALVLAWTAFTATTAVAAALIVAAGIQALRSAAGGARGSSPSRATPRAAGMDGSDAGKGPSAERTQAPMRVAQREEFLRAVEQDVGRSEQPTLLGLIRVANFDRILAFDIDVADRLIGATSRRLLDAASSRHLVARVDRDCFAIWFNAGAAEAAAELDAIGYVLGQELSDGDLTFTPDIQIGSARHPLDADEAGALLNRAFVSLAKPQRTEDGAIAFFGTVSAQEARRRFTLEQNLRRAVRRGELSLDYQPVVDLAMGRVVGAEALLRWRSEAHATPPPGEIVKILEDAGLINEVGAWSLNASCRQLRAWLDAGADDLKVAINVSACQLRDPALADAFERTVLSHQLSPSQIELELTETAAMEEGSRARALFDRLREIGFSLAIDDFGSGYSSLSYLRRLPFQKLKIDREFVTQVDQRADSRTICKALIDLTAGLELSVLAEGVERWEEVEMLRTMGCAIFQGFYFARPMPPQDFIATINDPHWLARLRSSVHRGRDEVRRRLS